MGLQGERHDRRHQLACVDKAIRKIEEKLEQGEVKATVGDYIRLLELKKQFLADQPREIKVTWVEPKEEESASEA